MNKDLQEITNTHVDDLCLRICERMCSDCTVSKTDCKIRGPVQAEMSRLVENILVVTSEDTDDTV